jgi:hypothetical protein
MITVGTWGRFSRFKHENRPHVHQEGFFCNYIEIWIGSKFVFGGFLNVFRNK